MSTRTAGTAPVGFAFDAGPRVGYGHAVRCFRIAGALAGDARPVFFPLSGECGRFLAGRNLEVRTDGALPPVMISDVPRRYRLVDAIAGSACRHISIRDLGLAQSDAHVVIDGGITRIAPYPSRPDRPTFLGPDYMVVAPPKARASRAERAVFVSLGGGAGAGGAVALAEALASTGFQVYATPGFERATVPAERLRAAIRWVDSDEEIENAVARCGVAVTTAGVSLYEMLAAGIPAVALGVDTLQLRTAEAFGEEGAVESLGLLGEIEPVQVAERARAVFEDPEWSARLIERGRRLVDGKGLSRVTEIVRSELCRTA